MPNKSENECNINIMDGYSYVVEIKKGDKYRTYAYLNPWAKSELDCKSGDKILAIAKIIMNDYGFEDFRSDE